MKTQINITTSSGDLDRYVSDKDLISVLDRFGLDGVEMMYCGEDEEKIIPAEKVIGLHMSCPYAWLDFWNGDMKRCLKEFDTLENVYTFYGGRDRQALIEHFCKDVEIAKRYQAEYMVFHVSDTLSLESMTGRYHHTDEEVIDAACELINAVLEKSLTNYTPLLLLENLWEPGLTFTRPEMTKRLLDGIKYPNKGIMLDTGHLLHTNLKLRTQEEAVAYIHECLDRHGDLCQYIRGIHLNQSLTGIYMEEVHKNPPTLSDDYWKRMETVYTYVFKADQHKPFTCAGVKKLIERIHPDYLTYEFISENREAHMEMLKAQVAALGK